MWGCRAAENWKYHYCQRLVFEHLNVKFKYYYMDYILGKLDN